MFKKTDYIVIAFICFLLGVFVVSQALASKKYQALTQPENNAVLALEVSKLTKDNSDLRNEVTNLTINLDAYKNSNESNKEALDLFSSDINRFSVINGEKAASGQGVLITINGALSTPQVVDLVNALKNIGVDVMSINEKRIIVNTDMAQFSGLSNYEIKVLGNSNLLKTAMERKGGIVEQITTKDIRFNIAEESSLAVPASGPQIKFKYAKIID